MSHPIQYQAPLLRRIAQEPDIDLTVFFGSDYSVRGYKDAGFGVEVKWDVPLLEGYRSEFLPLLRDGETASITRPMNYGIFSRLRGKDSERKFDALWVHGYSTANALHGILAAKMLGIPVLLRAEPWLKDRPRSGTTLAAKRCFFAILRRLITAALPIGTLNADVLAQVPWRNFPLFLMPYAVDNAYFQQRSADASATRARLAVRARPRPVAPRRSSSPPSYRHASAASTSSKPMRSFLPVPRPITKRVANRIPICSSSVTARSAQRSKPAPANSAGTSIRFLGFRNQSELPGLFDPGKRLRSAFALRALGPHRE